MKIVLLIEDDESFHYLCKIAFKRAGEEIELITAYDGIEAIQYLREYDKRPDLILVDINMPRMNGHEFLSAYSEMNPGEIPVVAMLTSSDDSRDRDSAMSHWFVRDYLVKPLMVDHIATLQKICEDTPADSAVT